MAVVAVLEIHMDKNAEVINNSSTDSHTRPPARRITALAMALSRPCSLSAEARAKPPRNRKMIGWAKLASASFTGNTPSSAASTGTSKAVMVTGIASVIHRVPASNSRARPALTCAPSGAITTNTTATSSAMTASIFVIVFPWFFVLQAVWQIPFSRASAEKVDNYKITVLQH